MSSGSVCIHVRVSAEGEGGVLKGGGGDGGMGGWDLPPLPKINKRCLPFPSDGPLIFSRPFPSDFCLQAAETKHKRHQP